MARLFLEGKYLGGGRGGEVGEGWGWICEDRGGAATFNYLHPTTPVADF